MGQDVANVLKKVWKFFFKTEFLRKAVMEKEIVPEMCDITATSGLM